MMTTISFVRHGMTDYNLEKRTQGHRQNPLNDTGRAQAAAVARRLAGESWDLLMTSDLLRARETAEIISAEVGIPISVFDSRLREINRGLIEGTIEEERIAKWGKDWRQLDLGEESESQVRERGMHFVRDTFARYPGNKILVVSHGILIGQTLKGLMEDETTGVNLKNTSITTITQNGHRWAYLLYDCTKHLQ